MDVVKLTIWSLRHLIKYLCTYIQIREEIHIYLSTFIANMKCTQYILDLSQIRLLLFKLIGKCIEPEYNRVIFLVFIVYRDIYRSSKEKSFQSRDAGNTHNKILTIVCDILNRFFGITLI